MKKHLIEGGIVLLVVFAVWFIWKRRSMSNSGAVSNTVGGIDYGSNGDTIVLPFNSGHEQGHNVYQ